MNLPEKARSVSVAYEALGGVDFSTQGRSISPRRSPRMENMYKRYADGFSDFLETRPGMRTLHDFHATIHALYRLGDALFIHAGAQLCDMTGKSIGTLADAPSQGFVFDGALYLLDGENYYRFDGKTLSVMEGTVPMTTVGRAPLGGGTALQPVN